MKTDMNICDSDLMINNNDCNYKNIEPSNSHY